MNRRKAREKAFQLLFQLDINSADLEHSIQTSLEEGEQDEFLKTVVEGVIKQQKHIDQMIADNLQNWSLGRLASVERTILRMATYEIEYMDDIPINVTINEAVEIANIYGDENSGKFVNGVLSNIIKH